MQKQIAVLGSTGSVGTTALQVARHLKDKFRVGALAAKSNIDLLEKQAREFNPGLLAVYEESAARSLQKRLPHIPVLSGLEGLKAVATFADFSLFAMSGTEGVVPALAAIRAKKQIGIANKEILVCAGELIQSEAKKYGVELLPVDSEHSAIFQCLKGEKKSGVRRLILTASGGPFLHYSISQLANVQLEHAMAHPNYRMGAKATIDSSTLMNKGLEMIEARWFFDVAPEKIEAVIHPQQRIHSFVEFIDGSMLAQMSDPDMFLPIQYAMTYPEREAGLTPPYDFMKNGTLTFFPPDPDKFRCFGLALEALKAGKSTPCFLNAANEVLVDRFLKKEISWMEIGIRLEKLISSHVPQNLLTLEAILEVDGLAREKARRI
jgi:1-deoxy-D-xylulose-5-phosphate reductoisomerase